MPSSRSLLSALIALATLAPSSARAFERSAVDSDPSTALFWRFRTIGVRLVERSAEDVTDAEIRGALSSSIGSWNAAANGCSDLELYDDGPALGVATNLDGGAHDSENRIRWREDAWPEEAGPETLALTTIVFRRVSGQILDADIDVNGVDHAWAVSPEAVPGRADVENTMTHELGHLIGLAHVIDPDATMFAESGPGDVEKRTLSQDELDAVCAIYPRRGLSPGAPVIPSTPLVGGCAIGGRGARLPFALAALAVALRRRRAR